jgi:predicted DCC family thiol-disulfide oxidoreductase YuxK
LDNSLIGYAVSVGNNIQKAESADKANFVSTLRTVQQEQQHILLFDGVCNLCNAVVKFVIRWDKQAKFKFASLQSPAGQRLLRQFNLSVTDPDSFVYVKGEKYYLRSSAALHLLKELGGGWQLLYLFMAVPKPLRDLCYRIIAKNRYRLFGKSDSCMMPTPELQKRFLNE